MTHECETPFDSIESAHDFVRVLAETITEAKQEIDLDLERELTSKTPRRQDALRIAIYNLNKLQIHINCSRRILNDLRSLRRLLFEEREAHRVRGIADQPLPATVQPNEVPALVAAIPAPVSPSLVRYNPAPPTRRAVPA